MAFPTRKEFVSLVRRVEELELKLASYGKEPAEPTAVTIPDIETALDNDEPDDDFVIVDKDVTDLLIDAGFTTKEAVAAASDEELRAIKGIGPSTLNKIRTAVGG